MMTPVLTPLLPASRPTTTSRQAPVLASPVSAAQVQAAPSAENLASSIMADGGLGFLQARLQEKMEGLFGSSDTTETMAFDSSGAPSPEATADRIVGLALSLRGAYERQHEGQSPEEMWSGFEAEIRRGISDGFDHARGVLSDLDLMESKIQDNVDLTWNLIQQKLEDFFHPQVVSPEED